MSRIIFHLTDEFAQEDIRNLWIITSIACRNDMDYMEKASEEQQDEYYRLSSLKYAVQML